VNPNPCQDSSRLSSSNPRIEKPSSPWVIASSLALGVAVATGYLASDRVALAEPGFEKVHHGIAILLLVTLVAVTGIGDRERLMAFFARLLHRQTVAPPRGGDGRAVSPARRPKLVTFLALVTAAVFYVVGWHCVSEVTMFCPEARQGEGFVVRWTSALSEGCEKCTQGARAHVLHPLWDPTFKIYTISGESPVGGCQRRDWALVCSVGVASGKKPLRVALIKSGDLAYTREIERGFRDVVRATLGEQGVLIDVRTGPATASASTDLAADYEPVTSYLATRSATVPYDYYVAIGTQAAMAMNNHLLATNPRAPFIFLGVTDPVRAGLVTSYRGRDEIRPLAGVKYGEDGSVFVTMLRRALPGSKLAFVYDSRVPQDMSFAAQIARSGVPLIALDHTPAGADLPQTDTVYISWYSMESLFENAEGIKMLRRRRVASSTSQSVMSPMMAPLAIAPFDVEIGRLGGQLVLGHRANELVLGRHDVYQPQFRLRLNCDTLTDLGLVVSPDVDAFARFGDCSKLGA
jgi:hypothetical protein